MVTLAASAASQKSGRGFLREIPFRSLLVPLDLFQIALAFVVLYFAMHLELMWLRTFTMRTVVWLSGPLGMRMQIVGPDLMVYRGRLSQFVLACTFVHMYLSTSCILWNRRRSLVHNLVRLAAFAIFMFVLDILRLEIAFLLPDDPQEWAHTLVTGFSGFIVYLAVVYQIEHPFAWFLTHGLEPFPVRTSPTWLQLALPSW